MADESHTPRMVGRQAVQMGWRRWGKRKEAPPGSKKILLAKSCEGRYCEPAEKGVGLQVRKQVFRVWGRSSTRSCTGWQGWVGSLAESTSPGILVGK